MSHAIDICNFLVYNTINAGYVFHNLQLLKGVCKMVVLKNMIEKDFPGIKDEIREARVDPWVYGWLSRGAYGNNKTIKAGDQAFKTINFKDLGIVYEPLSQEVHGYLDGWSVVDVFDDTKSSGYFSVLYANKSKRQAVLAVRGSEGSPITEMGHYGDWATDFDQIFGNNIVAAVAGRAGQQPVNQNAFLNCNKYAKKEGYTLSFTGHSLGGWLAALCVMHARLDGVQNVSATLFDAPGSREMMEKMKSNIRDGGQIDLDSFDITSYQSTPNFVNTANHHIGSIYCCKSVGVSNTTTKIEKGYYGNNSTLDSWLKVWDWPYFKQKRENIIDAIKIIPTVDSINATISGHPMSSFLKFLVPAEMSNWVKMSDWPSLIRQNSEYGGIPANITSAVKPRGVITETLSLLASYITGGIKDEQLKEARQTIINEALDKDKSYIDNFVARFIAHYRVASTCTGYILDIKHKEVDRAIYSLWSTKDELHNVKILSEYKEFKDFFKRIAQCYEIIRENGNFVMIKTNSKDDKTNSKPDVLELSDIVDIMKLAISEVPATIFDKLTGATKSLIKSEYLYNNIPTNLSNGNLINRHDDIKKIDKLLSDKKVCFLSGASGTGKTSIAAKYLWHKQAEGFEIRWLNAGDGMLKSQCVALAEDLGINSSGKSVAELADEVVMHLSLISVIFVLDNADCPEEITWLLSRTQNLNNVKVLITVNSKFLDLFKNNEEFKDHGFAELTDFTNHEATLYLQQKLPQKSERDWQILIKKVGTLPLELRNAVAAFVNNKILTMDSYFSSLPSCEDSPTTMYLISKLPPNARVMMDFMAFCSPDVIPMKLLEALDIRRYATQIIKHEKNKNRKVDEKEALASEYVKSNGVKVLLDMLLIENGANESHRMHREIKRCAIDNLKKRSNYYNDIQSLKQSLIQAADKLIGDALLDLQLLYDVKNLPEYLKQKIHLLESLIPSFSYLWIEGESGFEDPNSYLRFCLGVAMYYFYVRDDKKTAIKISDEIWKTIQITPEGFKNLYYKAAEQFRIFISDKGDEEKIAAIKGCIQKLGEFPLDNKKEKHILYGNILLLNIMRDNNLLHNHYKEDLANVGKIIGENRLIIIKEYISWIDCLVSTYRGFIGLTVDLIILSFSFGSMGGTVKIIDDNLDNVKNLISQSDDQKDIEALANICYIIYKAIKIDTQKKATYLDLAEKARKKVYDIIIKTTPEESPVLNLQEELPCFIYQVEYYASNKNKDLYKNRVESKYKCIENNKNFEIIDFLETKVLYHKLRKEYDQMHQSLSEEEKRINDHNDNIQKSLFYSMLGKSYAFKFKQKKSREDCTKSIQMLYKSLSYLTLELCIRDLYKNLLNIGRALSSYSSFLGKEYLLQSAFASAIVQADKKVSDKDLPNNWQENKRFIILKYQRKSDELIKSFIDNQQLLEDIKSAAENNNKLSSYIPDENLKLLAFAAINVGVLSKVPNQRSYKPVRKFVTKYSSTVLSAAKSHQDLFMDGTIVECIIGMNDVSQDIKNAVSKVQYYGHKEEVKAVLGHM